MIRRPTGTEMTSELLSELITEHKSEVSKRYQKLYAAYIGDYPIFHQQPKEENKPDNRVSVNFAKYIVDTMNGFFTGIPPKVLSSDEAVTDYITELAANNDLEDHIAELSKLTSIYGSAYEMYYVDELGQIRITHTSPMNSFIVYDDSILERPMFFIRYYQNSDNEEIGSYSDENYIRHFILKGGYKFTDEPKYHGFDGVPAVEFLDNEERIGLYEGALPMMNAYNKVISEKTNDVEYFADAYLKILGAALSEEEIRKVRERRIINFEGSGDGMPVVDFLQRPNSDSTQENLLNRLHDEIFQTCMVADISDEHFGTASGIALKYKMEAMDNRAKVKERKFRSGMQKRYILIFSNPACELPDKSWNTLSYKFTMNYPANLLEETQIARNLAGIVSEDTQMSVLSIVENVQNELDKKAEEQKQMIDLMKGQIEEDE